MTKKRGRDDLGEVLAAQQQVSLPKRSKAAANPDSGNLSETPETATGQPGEGESGAAEVEEEEDDDDYTSSSGTSSSSSSDDDQSDEDEDDESLEPASKDHDEDVITNVPGRPKPKIQRLQNTGLLSRISSFLPQLQAANVDLEQKLASGASKDLVLDEVGDEEGQYIEMNLGLGVLEEKKDDGGSSQDDASDSRPEDDEPSAEASEGRVMDRLLGIKSRSKEEGPGIQEIEDG